MTSDRAKKLLLAALSITVIYVWYGNIQLFTGSSSADVAQENITTKMSPLAGGKSSSGAPELAFVAPKFNPFSPFSSETKGAKSPTRNETNKSAPVTSTPPVSGLFQLIGTVIDGRSGFVTLKDAHGSQLLLAKGDSLSGWRLRYFSVDYAVFAQGNLRDTLRLKTTALE